MIEGRGIRRGIYLFGAGAFFLSAAAAGDWLVLRDGSRVETSGAWEVKGRQVVFTRPDGTLAALRLADVDLDASDVATAESRVAPPPPKAATAASGARKPILRLTNEDLPAVDPEAETAGDAEAEQSPQEADDQPVRLVSWDSRENADGDALEITGSVRNTGGDVVAGIRVRVTVLDADENPVSSSAFLQRSSLAPGRSTTFRALLPGIYTLLEDPTFEIESEGLTVQGPARPAGAQEGEEGDEEDFEFEPDDEPPP